MPKRLPILYIPFSRPKIVRRVFKRIREQQPARLYLAMDGAREGHPEEQAANRQIREYLDGAVDWPCQVVRLFEKKNCGPNRFILQALDWFFSQEEMGLILEEDCLPSPAYFEFCCVLLERYAEDQEVGIISGANVVPFFSKRKVCSGNQCIASRYPQIWGLATWRRVWLQADRNMERLDSFLESGYLRELFFKRDADHYERLFRAMRDQSLCRWDALVDYCLLERKKRVIYPADNMISNIGDAGGYNTQAYDPFLNVPVQSAAFPLEQASPLSVSPFFERYMRCYITPRTYWRTVYLMFKRWGLLAVPKLATALGYVLRRKLSAVVCVKFCNLGF